MAVIEVPIYTIHEGKREEFVELYEALIKGSDNVIAVEPTPGSAIQ